jgi:hypothetical protein
MRQRTILPVQGEIRRSHRSSMYASPSDVQSAGRIRYQGLAGCRIGQTRDFRIRRINRSDPDEARSTSEASDLTFETAPKMHYDFGFRTRRIANRSERSPSCHKHPENLRKLQASNSWAYRPGPDILTEDYGENR